MSSNKWPKREPELPAERAAGASTERLYKISLPFSNEDFGRWLEENNATIEISCQLGTYHVLINRHRLDAHKETGNLSVTRSGDVRVSVYDKEFDVALRTTMAKCREEPV